MSRLFKSILLLLIFAAAGNIYASEKIIAYPNPFNPERDTLTINYESGSHQVYSVTMEIFDINGDRVLKKSYSSLPVQWRGYNDRGVSVAAGLYIVKIQVEDISHSVKTEHLRILVKK